VDANAVIALLAEHYGIQTPVLTPVSGGTTALGFKVTSPQGNYFLKVFSREYATTAFWTEKICRYIPVLGWLRHQPHLRAHLPEPIRTLSGEVSCQDDARVLLLYAFIPGSVLPDNALQPAQVRTLARVTAALHNLRTASPHCPRTESEDYAAAFLPELEGLLADSWDYQLSMEIQRMAAPFEGLLRQRALELTRLQAALRESDLPLVLCHMDLHHWNLMECAGRLIILDWEGVKRAPAESDLMFILSLPYAADFMRVYQQERPGFALNPEALRFVVIRRKLEDIWLFMRALSLDPLEGSMWDQNTRWLQAGLNELGKESFYVA
jgi:Ser/Thr protein kinase RdoA (MazF antagonist)